MTMLACGLLCAAVFIAMALLPQKPIAGAAIITLEVPGMCCAMCDRGEKGARVRAGCPESGGDLRAQTGDRQLRPCQDERRRTDKGNGKRRLCRDRASPKHSYRARLARGIKT